MTDIGTIIFAGGNRSRMRWQEYVHHRKSANGGQAIRQHRLIHAARSGKHYRQHDHQPGIEENRETKNQRCDAEGKGRPLLAKKTHQGICQRLRTTGGFHQPPQHGTKTDQNRHTTQRATEILDQYLINNGFQRQPGDDSRQQADQHQGKQRMHTEADDHHQNQQDCTGSDGQQRACTQRLCPVIHQYLPLSNTTVWVPLPDTR